MKDWWYRTFYAFSFSEWFDQIDPTINWFYRRRLRGK